MIRTVMLVCTLGLGLLAAPAYASQGRHVHDFNSNELFDFSDKERWIIRVRALLFEPSNSANVSSIGGSADVDEQYAPELDFTYFMTENWGLELSLSAPPLDVTANNTSLGQLDLGNVWLFSPTLMLQHHFRPASMDFRPYLGAGINYAHFFNEDSGVVDSIDYEDSFGFALQAGFDYEINDHWALNLEVKKLLLDTDARVQTGTSNFSTDVDIDPWVFGIGVAYRF